MVHATDMVSAATSLASRGWQVLPLHAMRDGRCDCNDDECKSPGKHPRTRRGLKDATSDRAAIGKWFGQWPGANVGTITGEASGVVVLDIDGPVGEASLEKLIDEHGPLPDTPTVATGGGGRHFDFAHPGGKVPNSAGKIAPGVDVRGDGGYVVAPPSNHASGNGYRWLVGPEEVDPAPVPDWLLALMIAGKAKPAPTATPAPTPAPTRAPAPASPARGGRYVRWVFTQVLDELSKAPEGTRNNALNAAAFRLGQFVGAGLIDRGEAESSLARGAEALGLGDRESRLTIRSGLDSGALEPAELPEPKRVAKPATKPSAPAPASSDGADGEPVGGDGGEVVALGERDPDTGRVVLSPRRTLPTARAFVGQFFNHADGRTIHHYGGSLMAWKGNRFAMMEDGAARNMLLHWLDDALRYTSNRQTGELELVDFESNPSTVEAAHKSLCAYVHISADTPMPSWLDGRDGPDPRDVLPCKTVNVHIPSGTITPATPALFTGNALEFDYNPSAPAPRRWLELMGQIWPDDPEQMATLQEWFGYCLTADTSQQKILLIWGPKRSGKGTIGRVLTQLIGAGNMIGPTTDSLASQFGLQELIGKSLAIISDARFTGPNVGVSVERLLCISGEDTISVPRKFGDALNLKLPTRFMFLSNEVPKLSDASAALAARFVLLRIRRSFYGGEDPTLGAKLRAELPGILLWAIEGWKRLRDRGHFIQPSTTSEHIAELEDLASPVLSFIRDRCEVGPGHWEWVDGLYAAWQAWCKQEGIDYVCTKQVFGRNLAAADPGISVKKSTDDRRFYTGVRLKFSLGAL